MKRGPHAGPKEYKNLAELETEVQATRFGEEDGAFIPPPEIADMEHVIRQTLEQGVRDGARWLDEAVNEVKPLSAEMRLRILLAEDAIQKATRAEVMAKPYVDHAQERARKYGTLWPGPFQAGSPAQIKARKDADALEREREIGELVNQRTWWSDNLQPPELTPAQAAVLKKYVDRGVPVFKEYLDEARGSEPVEADERKRASTWAADAFHEIKAGEEPKWHPHRVK